EFFYANEDDLFLTVSYGSTGLASLYKTSAKGTMPHPARGIQRRDSSAIAMMRHQPSLLASSVKHWWRSLASGM
ncbi:MAG: hypothetical protein AAFX40_01355, partial [Cyanobacteria bacterium J06639_1]